MTTTGRAQLDPRTPVVVGVGQYTERLLDHGYRAMSAVQLAAAAAARAIDDAQASGDVARAIDTVAGVRQFEISSPRALAPLGRSNNFPRSVAARIGCDPRRAILEVSGGQAPQHLVTELAGTIAAGTADVALVFGSEAISTTRHLAGTNDAPDFNETMPGDLEDRGFGLSGMDLGHLARHGLTGAPAQYALLENARRHRLGLTRAAYASAMGELFAPFTRVSAANPYSASPTARTAEELVTVTAANRLVADPYPRYVVARDQVNQGAAALLMSVEAAARFAVPRDRWIFLIGHADATERTLLERPDLSTSPAAVQAAQRALDMAGHTFADLSLIDLYSCFPAPVFNMCDHFGLGADDPRGLTVTGGLPFFGGAGNNYSMHAIAETVHGLRAARGSVGFVGANGGIMSKYSVGVYSSTPRDWNPGDDLALQASLDDAPRVDQAREASGAARVETCTVTYARSGQRSGVLVGRLTADGRRFVATVQDDDLLAVLAQGEPFGVEIEVMHGADGRNTARLARA